jgi:hypothetical protein
MEAMREKRLKKISIVGSILLCIVVLLTWVGYRYVNKPPVELPAQTPVTMPLPAGVSTHITPEVPAPPQTPSAEQQPIGSQRHSSDKQGIADDNSVDLSSHTMSIKREEKKGFQVMPGVNVKRGVVNIQLDEKSDRTIEIEKDPDNSNSDYQLLLKKKF